MAEEGGEREGGGESWPLGGKGVKEGRAYEFSEKGEGGERLEERERDEYGSGRSVMS